MEPVQSFLLNCNLTPPGWSISFFNCKTCCSLRVNLADDWGSMLTWTISGSVEFLGWFDDDDDDDDLISFSPRHSSRTVEWFDVRGTFMRILSAPPVTREGGRFMGGGASEDELLLRRLWWPPIRGISSTLIIPTAGWTDAMSGSVSVLLLWFCCGSALFEKILQLSRGFPGDADAVDGFEIFIL